MFRLFIEKDLSYPDDGSVEPKRYSFDFTSP